MSTITVPNAVKIVGLPDTWCYKSLRDFAVQFAASLAIEIPSSITNVVISNQQPSSTSAIWFATNNNGVFLGVKVYSAGKWIQVFPEPQQVFWTWGDSREIAPGYELIDTGTAGIPASVITHIKLQYLRDPGNLYYMYFATIFRGV